MIITTYPAIMSLLGRARMLCWPLIVVGALMTRLCDAGAKVAVVGGGIGGCATSWFLHERLGDQVDTVLYEPAYLGGRVRVVEVDGRYYEAGASVIHGRNRIFSTLCEKFGFEKLGDDDDENISGLFDGTNLVFQSTGWKIADAAKLIWRYGLSAFKLQPWVNNYIDRFSKIYDLFQKNCSYHRPSDLIFAADPQLAEMFNVTLEKRLMKDGFSASFVKEVAGAAMRANYNQGVDVPAFVGSISMAGMDGPLFRVKGGNDQIPVELCTAVDHRKHAAVTEISRMDSGRYRVSSDDGDMRDFDYVVIAAPMERNASLQTKIVFNGFPVSFHPENWEGDWRRTVATFVKGTFDDTFYHGRGKLDQVIDVDLVDVVGSISRLSDVSGNLTGTKGMNSSVWKIFSNRPLKEDELDRIFPVDPGHMGSRTVKVFDWKAYPDYLKSPKRSPPFTLFENMYYLNAVEWLGSAMEMSLIGAKNIAVAVENTVLKRQPACPVRRENHEKDEL